MTSNLSTFIRIIDFFISKAISTFAQNLLTNKNYDHVHQV